MNHTFKFLSFAFSILGVTYVTGSIIAGLVMESHDSATSAWNFSNWPVWLRILFVTLCVVANIPTFIGFYRSTYVDKTGHGNDISKD